MREHKAPTEVSAINTCQVQQPSKPDPQARTKPVEIYLLLSHCNTARIQSHSLKSRKGEPRQWRRTPLVPALGRQRQVDLCQFEASLIYRGSSRTARATQRNLVSKNKNNKTKKKSIKGATEIAQ